MSHKNIIQFYGAVTVAPNFCLVTGTIYCTCKLFTTSYRIRKILKKMLITYDDMIVLDSFAEYAQNGSLYAFLRLPDQDLQYIHILHWACDIASGVFHDPFDQTVVQMEILGDTI